MFVKPACNPEGRGVRGLVIGNARRSGRVKRGAQSVLALSAPRGAHFKRYTWSGETARSDCRYSIYSYAKGPGMKAFTVTTRRKRNRSPFKGCPRRGRFQASGNPRPTTHPVGNDLRGADRIVHRVKCHGSHGCAASGVNRVRIYKASVTVSDRTPPLVAITGGALASGRWVSGRQVVQYAAADNVGVQKGVLVGAQRIAPKPRAHVTSPGWSRVQTGRVDLRRHEESSEGTQPVTVEATDAAGNRGRSRQVTARVDNTPPARVNVADRRGRWLAAHSRVRPPLGQPSRTRSCS